jgi:hypothetical protein
VIDVVADVFFVGEHLMHRAPVPSRPKSVNDALRVQRIGNLGFNFCRPNECPVNPPHDFDLLIRAGTSTTRSVWMLFCSPIFNIAFFLAVWSISIRRRP